MKATSIIAALGFALLGAGVVHAGQADGAKTRAEVRAETLQAAARGELNQFGEGVLNVDRSAAVGSAKSRAAVVQETIAAIARGEIAYGEGESRSPSRDFVSTKSRAEVRAEAAEALANGTLLSRGQFTQG